MNTVLLLCCFLFVATQQVAAQKYTAPETLQQIKAYNVCIDYFNEAAHYISVPHDVLRDFNIKANNLSFDLQKGLKKGDRVLQETPVLQFAPLFEKQHYFTMPCVKYKDSPHENIEELYQKARQQLGVIEPGFRQRMDELLVKSHELTTEYQRVLKQLERHTRDRLYVRDSALTDTYMWLEKYSLICFDFSVLGDKIFDLILEAIQYQPLLDGMSQLHALNTNAHLLLLALRRDDIDAVRSFNQRLESNLAARNKLVESAQNPELFPYLEMDDFSPVLREADAIVALANDYLTKKMPWKAEGGKIEYEGFGASYYYGEQVYRHSVHYHSGITYEFNKFLMRAKKTLLRQMEEPMWFKVMYRDPQVPKIDEAAILESLKAAMAQANVPPPPPSLEGSAANNLTFLLDVSHSMDVEDKMPLLRRSFRFLTELLRPEDNVSVVTYAGRAKVVLPSTSGIHKQELNEAIDKLTFSGKTDGLAGATLAYDEANKNFIKDGNNRIIIATDGKFIIDEKLEKMIKKNTKKGIYLSVFQYGKGESKVIEDKLRLLAEMGGGNYFHIADDESSKDSFLKEATAIRK